MNRVVPWGKRGRIHGHSGREIFRFWKLRRGGWGRLALFGAEGGLAGMAGTSGFSEILGGWNCPDLRDMRMGEIKATV